MQILTGVRNCVLILLTSTALFSCSLFKKKNSEQSSAVTGWNYKDKNAGGFYIANPKNVPTPPNMVFVQGGTFTMGAMQEDVMDDWNNVPRRVTVNSFFIDKTEVANVDYRKYLNWVENVFNDPQYQKVVDAAMPDTLVWRSELAYNEPYVEAYFRHPSYNYYPVVGISWKQANDFCQWRTDYVNEQELIRRGYINPKNLKTEFNGGGEEHFNTQAYLMGEYQPQPGKIVHSKSNPLKDINGKPRANVRFEDGLLFGSFRLPNEAEWEYAAYGYIAENVDRKSGKKRGEELISNKQVYAWKDDGYDNLRYTNKSSYQGAFMANFKRGNGDYMGIAGGLNDNAATPAPINSYFPNGFGLYNMSGNVSEWVSDVYRPLTNLDENDLNPYRGNVFMKVDKSKGEGNLRDSLGKIRMIPESDSALRNRRNYQHYYALNYMDGDTTSGVSYGYGLTTLISDKSRVIKGGSWNDMPYWLSPGTRRFMEEDLASSTVGFRCAMTHYGPAEGLSKDAKSGNFIPVRRTRR